MRYSLLLGTIFAAATITSANADTGVVVLRVSGCDYYVISATGGFVIAEWYGGYDPDKGDVVIGSFISYGMKTLFFQHGQAESRAYIEDYWLGQDETLEKMSDKCS
jgi:hypothetical protein